MVVVEGKCFFFFKGQGQGIGIVFQIQVGCDFKGFVVFVQNQGVYGLQFVVFLVVQIQFGIGQGKRYRCMVIDLNGVFGDVVDFVVGQVVGVSLCVVGFISVYFGFLCIYVIVGVEEGEGLVDIVGIF